MTGIERNKEPIRLFQSDVLEFFTHIHPLAVLAIWLPVVALFLYLAIGRRPEGLSLFYPILVIVAGLFLWTLAEYSLHRFVFHFRPRTPWQERLSFLFHGVHHAQPMCKTRLVMPPAVSIPLALVFLFFAWLVLAVVFKIPYWIAPLSAGMSAGYLIYDMLHYSTHHFPVRRGLLKYLRQYHMKHHAQTPNARFGVTSPLWDIVFGTRPA